jgi:sugar phosphate permease
VNDTPARASLLTTRPTYVRHLVLAALCVITTINYVQRNSFGGVEKAIRDAKEFPELGILSTGLASGGFFFAYALCQIPSGWLAQRWGAGRTLALLSGGWSIVMGLTALAMSFPSLLAARLAMGALQAGIFPCSTMILAVWYPSTRRGFASAVLNSFMLIGGVVASLLTGLLIERLGWRALFFFYALPGLVWACWFAVWFRSRPRDHPGVDEAEQEIIGQEENPPSSGPAPAIPWRRIFGSTALWLICAQQFCRAGALRLFDQWLPTYLQEARGQQIGDANLWTSLPLLGGVVGGMAGGILSDRVLAHTGSRRAARQGVAIGSLLTCLLCFGLCYLIPDVGGAMMMAGLGVCIMSFSSPCAYALTMDMSGRNLGIIFGAMNMAGNLGSWAFVTFLPLVVRYRGWDAALLVFAAMPVVAILCWLRLNPEGIIGENPDDALAPKE